MKRTCWVNLAWFTFYLLGAVSPCSAEIVVDGSLGGSAGQDIPKIGDEFTIRADMGQQRDNNLFHSFGKFNLSAGEIATFNDGGASGLIDRIFARITGGESNIDGTLRTQFSNTQPDLYLINPQGIIFGPNAKLDVQGSFHASTSDFIQLEDDVRFNAAPKSDQLLSSSPPSAFGFLETNQGTITISGSDLRVPEGRSLSIIANDTKVLNGKLDAPRGYINIGQFTSGDILATNRLTQELSTSDSGPPTPPADFEAQDIYIRSGNLIISGETKVGQPGGDITITVGKLALKEGGRLDSSSTFNSGTSAGNINIQTRDSVAITGQSPSSKSRITANIISNNTDDKAGNINLASPVIHVAEGMVTANAIIGGTSGTIDIQTNKLTLQNGAAITTANLSVQQGGSITIHAKDSILIDGSNINSATRGAGDAGQVIIATQQLIIQNSGQISTAADGDNSTGNAGSINLQVDELMMREGGLISAKNNGKGRGGDIEIHSTNITLASQGKISAESQGAGQSGNINITASDIFQLRDKSAISLTTDKVSAGDINLDVKHLFYLSDDSAITTSAQNGAGNGGNIQIGQKIAPEIMILDKTSYITAQAKKGNGGDIQAVIDYFFGSPENINASSALGINGQVDIATVASDVVANIQKLPESYVHVSALIQTPCLPQTTVDRSSLVVVPRDGRLTSPDALLASRFVNLESNSTALPVAKFNDSRDELTSPDFAECQHALSVNMSAQN